MEALLNTEANLESTQHCLSVSERRNGWGVGQRPPLLMQHDVPPVSLRLRDSHSIQRGRSGQHELLHAVMSSHQCMLYGGPYFLVENHADGRLNVKLGSL